MKKMIIYVDTIVVLMVIILFVVESITYKDGKNKKYILKNIDFSDAEYTLYIRHKTYGKFMVLNEEALIENKNKLEVKGSFINYLPGEGDRDYGVILFKDKELITLEMGGVFNVFKIGNLKDYAIAVERKRFHGIKALVKEKIDSIENNKRMFLTYKPATFEPDNRSFRFRVYFPSIAIPVTRGKDSFGYKRILTINGIDKNTWDMKKETVFEKNGQKS